MTIANLDSKALQAKDLLSLLLPKFVLDGMKNYLEMSGETTCYEDVGDVAILFCDIADFDDVVRLNENNVVFLLDKIFRKFDDLCVMYGVQKIETVGKTYMAAAGIKIADSCLPVEQRDIHPTERVLNLAKAMMRNIKDFEKSLGLKIGVHIGKPVMGVIGYHKPQFSLIGDAVNTTSRHCTTGKKDHIMVSQAAHDSVTRQTLLSGLYNYKIIPTEMKGKGKVNVYYLFAGYSVFRTKILSIA